MKTTFALNYNGNYCYPLRVEIGNTLNREISNLDFEVKGMEYILPGQLQGFEESQCQSSKRFRYYKPVVDSRWYRFYLSSLQPVVSTNKLSQFNVTLRITVLQVVLFFILCVLHFFYLLQPKND